MIFYVLLVWKISSSNKKRLTSEINTSPFWYKVHITWFRNVPNLMWNAEVGLISVVDYIKLKNNIVIGIIEKCGVLWYEWHIVVLLIRYPCWALGGFQSWWILIHKLSTLTSAVSVLIQLRTLLQNLWTALVQLWSPLRTHSFRAARSSLNSALSVLIQLRTLLENLWKRWFSCVQRWEPKVSERQDDRLTALFQHLYPPKTFWTALIFFRFRMTYFSSIFMFLRNISKYLYFEPLNSSFQPNWTKEVINQNSIVQFFHRPKI